jgi:hypothetical protein
MEDHQQNTIERLKTCIQQIGERSEEELVGDFLEFNNDTTVPDSFRSLALDAMLVAEGDLNGEFTSKEALLLELDRLAEQKGDE